MATGTTIQQQGKGLVLASEAGRVACTRLAARWPVYVVAVLSAAAGFWALAALVAGVLHCCATSAAVPGVLARMIAGI